MLSCVKQLGELCSDVVLNNTHVLEDSKRVEEVVETLARREAFNASILQIIDHKSWIKSLDLKASNITDEGLERICGISWLTILNLSECAHVSDEGLLKFKDHRHLRILQSSIDVSKTKVSDVGVQGLATCVNLDVLDISYTQIGDGSVANFGGHPKLQSLIARNTRVSDRTLLSWQSTKSYPVALHTLILPFTKITDASAKAISGIPSLSLLDVKSTKYSMNGLALIQGAWRQRHKGKNVKLHPGNKLEVLSCPRAAPITVESPLAWLHDAVCDYALFKGKYAQRQKRIANYTSSLSVIGAFSHMNLASSQDVIAQLISQSSSDTYTSTTPTTAPCHTDIPDPFATPINISDSFILPAFFTEMISESTSATTSTPPSSENTNVLPDLPISISLDSILPIFNTPISSSSVSISPVTTSVEISPSTTSIDEPKVDISPFASVDEPKVVSVVEEPSTHYDFPSDDEGDEAEAVTISPEVTPTQPLAQPETSPKLQPVLSKTKLAKSKPNPKSKPKPKPVLDIPVQQEALTVRRSARTANAQLLAVKPANTKSTKPTQAQTSKPKPKLPQQQAQPSEADKENQHPQGSTTVLGKRKSARIQESKRPKVQAKVESTPEPLPPKKYKRKAPSTITPAKSKRTRLATPAPATAPTPAPPISHSPHHTRASRGHEFITVPLEALLPKKQKRKVPNPPTPKGPPSLPAEIPDSPQPRSPYLPASTDTITTPDISQSNNNDAICEADVSAIAQDSSNDNSINETPNTDTSSELLDSGACDPSTSISNTSHAELPTSPITVPCQHDTNLSIFSSPINLSDSSILLPTPCDAEIATDSNLISHQPSPPCQESNYSSPINLSDSSASEPSTPSLCTSPSRPSTPIIAQTPPTNTEKAPIFESPSKTSSASCSSTPKRTLPKPSLAGFRQSYTSPQALSPNPQTPPRPLRLSFDFSKTSCPSPFTSTPTRKRSLPSPTTSRTTPTRKIRSAPTTPSTPRTPTTPSNFNPAKVLSPAERERNNKLNSEFLRMRKLLLY